MTKNIIFRDQFSWKVRTFAGENKLNGIDYGNIGITDSRQGPRPEGEAGLQEKTVLFPTALGIAQHTFEHEGDHR